ncbi:MAG: isocitrate lyase/PEP mutase family protein [Alphaproteobacteria bacterium]|nr:isocitrate lyase/PEP mutase family protein [Alphaproteobacteria bacterium]MBU0888495.1 isocitrate lyase/PEP mutase family protein [Alphaproteobacteria bacterium]MBU1813042.1 isocitrate lyase/PEP mutase family protein [Alphaproteobacteria bacterium]MBU2091790.1 isocitrate lyase/PEP mutase family protein [Alphaproteobacteria bacterium]
MTTLRQILQRGEFVTGIGVYDMISARIADRTSANAIYVTGYGTVASHLGLPDAGIATYTDMVGRIARIVDGTNKPVIADADTGYGGLLNVHHTVRGYEKAGVSAIQLEDQEFPKKCGHTKNRRVIPMADMAQKIRVASDARSSEDFLIIARTDARTGLGLEEALRRGEAYAEAGADIIFIESPESEAEMAEIAKRFDKPTLINLVHGGSTPILPKEKLVELGFGVAIYPGLGFLAAARALEDAFNDLAAGKENTTPIYDFSKFNEVIGFPEVWEFDRKYAAPGS